MHHLYIPFFALFLAHGAFCFVKADVGPKCGSLPDFWKFWILSGIIFIIEKVVREQWIDRILSLLSNSPLTQFEIITVIQHPSKVIEIRMCKPPNIAANVDYFHCGQYIFLNVPELSRFEWHPFTLTSAPEDKYISCHIRVCGEWTEKLSTRLGCMWSTPPALTTTTTDSKPGLLPLVSEPTIVGQKAREMLPIIRMDGPYGSIRDDMFNRKVCVMIGAGIGVTPFSSTLKSLWHRVVKPKRVIPLQKVYFVWICRDKENFEWFHQLIAAIESQMVDATSGHASHFSRFLDIRIHLTGQIKDIGLIQNIYMNTDHTSYSISNNNNTSQTDGLTGLRSLTYFGRPQFDKFFEEVSLAHPKTNVGVFYCGSDALGSTIQRQCHKSGGDHGTVFHFKHETF